MPPRTKSRQNRAKNCVDAMNKERIRKYSCELLNKLEEGSIELPKTDAQFRKLFNRIYDASNFLVNFLICNIRNN